MDGQEFGLDLEVINQAIDTADVLIIRFPFIDKRLLIDARSDEYDAPVIVLVPQASNIEERFRTVLEARPTMPVPDRIVSFQWPRHAEALRPAGVWDRILARLRSSGHPVVDRRCDEAWQAMLAEERREVLAAIRGSDRYQTVWERPAAGP